MLLNIEKSDIYLSNEHWHVLSKSTYTLSIIPIASNFCLIILDSGMIFTSSTV